MPKDTCQLGALCVRHLGGFPAANRAEASGRGLAVLAQAADILLAEQTIGAVLLLRAGTAAPRGCQRLRVCIATEEDHYCEQHAAACRSLERHDVYKRCVCNQLCTGRGGLPSRQRCGDWQAGTTGPLLPRRLAAQTGAFFRARRAWTYTGIHAYVQAWRGALTLAVATN